jgi:anti-anti-sigma factor
MSVLISRNRGVVVAIPSGRLDTNNAPEAEELIVKEIDDGQLRIVVDFAKTNYISSAGLRVILKAIKLLKQRGEGAIALCNANEQIQEVLEITGFLTMLKCHVSLDEAIRDVSG